MSQFPLLIQITVMVDRAHPKNFNVSLQRPGLQIHHTDQGSDVNENTVQPLRSKSFLWTGLLEGSKFTDLLI